MLWLWIKWILDTHRHVYPGASECRRSVNTITSRPQTVIGFIYKQKLAYQCGFSWLFPGWRVLNSALLITQHCFETWTFVYDKFSMSIQNCVAWAKSSYSGVVISLMIAEGIPLRSQSQVSCAEIGRRCSLRHLLSSISRDSSPIYISSCVLRTPYV